jgi:H+-transporting ATPase
MIEIAVVLSGAVGHWPDFFVILLLLVANGVVGYTEERQAGNAKEKFEPLRDLAPAPE